MFLAYCRRNTPNSTNLNGFSSITRHISSKKSTKSIKKNDKKSIKIGLFGDIHFQDKGLERIKRTGRWIVEEFNRNQVDAVVCLGDVLNTRDQVSIPAQSAAITFFNDLSETLNGIPIHVLLGNHDMHLKHSHSISSLDCLQLKGVASQNIFLHRELNTTKICGIDGLMIPYYENQQLILDYIRNLEEEKGKDFVKNLIGFGHLSVHGAYQHSKSEMRHSGSLTHGDFEAMKHVFSGHFHVPQRLGDRFRYIGAPLQFNFGDAGEDRGIAVYHTGSDKYEWIINPHCQAFKTVDETQLINLRNEDSEKFKDTFVMIQYTSALGALDYEKHKKDLLNLGALGVKQKSLFKANISTTKVSIEPISFESTIDKYVNDVKKNSLKNLIKKKDPLLKVFENEEQFEKLKDFGKRIVKKVNDTTKIESKEGPIFPAAIDNIKMVNFMGIQNEMVVSFRGLEEGIWLIEGKNGSGKSTLLEALSWCQFGEFIRSDMNKDYVINDTAEEAEVTVEFENGFSVRRSRRKGKPDVLRMFQLNENGENIELLENQKGELRATQEKLIDILGIDFSTFSKSIVLGQNVANNFITGGKDERRNIIEEALGLERFDQYFDHAKQNRVKVEQEISTRKNLIERHTESIERIQEEQKSSDLEKLDERRKELETKIREIGERFKGEFAEIEQNELSIKSQLKSTETVEKSEDNKEILHNLTKIEKELEIIRSIYDTMKHSETCDTCGQPIKNPDVLLENLKAKGNTVMDLIKSNSVTLSQFPKITPKKWKFNDEKTEHQLEISEQALNEIVSSLQLKERDNSMKREKITKMKMELLSLENRRMRTTNNQQKSLSDVERELASIDSLLKKHSELNKVSSERIMEHEQAIQEEKDLLPQYEAEYELYRFWETAFDKRLKAGMGFSPLRSFILEEAVNNLNQICREYMDNLSSKDPLTVTFSSNLELQENYGKRSGGERRRTDLVALFALFELVKQHSRYQSEFMILDEVFDALDQEGLRAVQSTIQVLAKKVKKVFVITHSPAIKELDITGKLRFEMKRNEMGKPIGSTFDIIRPEEEI